MPRQITRRKAKETHHPVYSPHSLEVILHEIPQTNRMIKIFLPAFHTPINADRNEALLAHRAAEAPGLVARGNMRQGIGQIVEFAPIEERRRHIVLEPENLWDFHLDAHRAPHIA